jgi:hypothetical protein
MFRKIVLALLAAVLATLAAAGQARSGLTFIVTTTADSGAGSLRQAILDANANPGKDRIEFAIPGPGVHVIGPQTVLPPATDPVVIDGTTQPGYQRFGPPLIEILGLGNFSGLGYPLATGLDIRGGKSAIMALAIGGFATGIVLRQAGKDSVVSSYVGVDPSGTTAIPNYAGIAVTGADGSSIGSGSMFGLGNVVSGNDTDGIHIEADHVVVQSNRIGTTADGLAALPNGNDGVSIADDAAGQASVDDTIGGTGPGNVISGNRDNGIEIAHDSLQMSGSTGTAVQGNYIGTDATGTKAIGNWGMGVFIHGASYNLIGGPRPQSDLNVISGNGLFGVDIVAFFDGPPATNNQISGNLIGTTADGQSALGNNVGVVISAASNTLIGSSSGPRSTRGAGNVISANLVGIDVDIFTSDTAIGGNVIGRAADRTTPLGNAQSGIELSSPNVTGTTIGGESDPNLIADNGLFGVTVGDSFDPGTFGNAISANSIVDNGNLGIDLNSDLVTPNDLGDGDSGPNGLQNFPVVTSVTRNNTKLSISGTLNSAPNAQFRIELFGNAACDPSGYGEGETYLGHTDVTTDGSGNASFAVALAAATTPFVTATATDANGNTSEFSACFPGG